MGVGINERDGERERALSAAAKGRCRIDHAYDVRRPSRSSDVRERFRAQGPRARHDEDEEDETCGDRTN